MSYFTFSFLSLNAYCSYHWFCNVYVLFLILIWVVDPLPLLYICFYHWDFFSLCIFSYLLLCCCQLLSQDWLFATPWTAARQAILSFTISQSLLKLMSIELRLSSNYFIFCPPLLTLPSILPRIRVFSNESGPHIRWPKYWSFSFSISPSNEYQGWFPLGMTDLISLLSKGLSRVFSSTMVQRHHFFSTQPSLWPNSHIHTWLQGKP